MISNILWFVLGVALVFAVVERLAPSRSHRHKSRLDNPKK